MCILETVDTNHVMLPTRQAQTYVKYLSLYSNSDRWFDYCVPLKIAELCLNIFKNTHHALYIPDRLSPRIDLAQIMFTDTVILIFNSAATVASHAPLVCLAYIWNSPNIHCHLSDTIQQGNIITISAYNVLLIYLEPFYANYRFNRWECLDH